MKCKGVWTTLSSAAQGTLCLQSLRQEELRMQKGFPRLLAIGSWFYALLVVLLLVEQAPSINVF